MGAALPRGVSDKLAGMGWTDRDPVKGADGLRIQSQAREIAKRFTQPSSAKRAEALCQLLLEGS